jgi:hypothetical protein
MVQNRLPFQHRPEKLPIADFIALRNRTPVDRLDFAEEVSEHRADSRLLERDSG